MCVSGCVRARARTLKRVRAHFFVCVLCARELLDPFPLALFSPGLLGTILSEPIEYSSKAGKNNQRNKAS